MSEQSILNTLLASSENIYLFVIQQGSYQNNNHFGLKLLTLISALFTMIMFILYSTDITAKMTSGPPSVPIKSFEDVILHGYRVIVTSGYYKSMLAKARPGTAKHTLYKRYLENQDNR